MSIVDEIKDTTEGHIPKNTNLDDVKKLASVYDRLKAAGLVKPQTYNLPHPDLIGISLSSLTFQKDKTPNK